jgi:phenol hydroxylase P5 protein
MTLAETLATDGVLSQAPQYNATLVRREDLTAALAHVWVRLDGDPIAFEPGQYLTIGVVVDGRVVQRPYSVASAPAAAAKDGYEFFVRLVPGGAFTPLLWRLPMGHRLRLIGPKGRFTLSDDDQRTHLFVSSGTGSAPFLAMMRAAAAEGRPRAAVFVNGVSFATDLGYRRQLEDWESSGTYPVRYVPTVSRPADPADGVWRGRTGRAESVLASVCDEHDLKPGNAVAYLCGNPDMVAAAEDLLHARGFSEGDVRTELYWPKARSPEPRTGDPA